MGEEDREEGRGAAAGKDLGGSGEPGPRRGSRMG